MNALSLGRWLAVTAFLVVGSALIAVGVHFDLPAILAVGIFCVAWGLLGAVVA
jgi:hypothetical protein